MTLGMREVESKRREWRDLKPNKDGTFLGHHSVPVIIGPKKRIFLIDHHHLCRALLEEGVNEVLVQTVQNLSWLKKEEFWEFMEIKRWVHPFDENGHRLEFKQLPKTIMAMVDDPYRALAGAARQNGAFAKEPTPFAEFAWANFLRARVKRNMVENDFESSLKLAKKLCQSSDARYLPGWCGIEEYRNTSKNKLSSTLKLF